MLHIRIAVDDFFEHSHNQPYSFFHEETFRSRLEQNLVPEHLLLAVLAAAARFAKGEANRISAGRVWADRSWDLVLKRLDSDEEIDVSVVQAAALSAIYDFVGRLSDDALLLIEELFFNAGTYRLQEPKRLEENWHLGKTRTRPGDDVRPQSISGIS